MPYEYDPFGYVYNADLYKDAGLNPDNPPKSWDDLRKVNDTLKAKSANSWPICQPINNLAKTMPWVWSSGADYWDKPVLPTKADFTNPTVTDVYKFQQEWSQKNWRNTDELSDAVALQIHDLAQMRRGRVAAPTSSCNSRRTIRRPIGVWRRFNPRTATARRTPMAVAARWRFRRPRPTPKKPWTSSCG